MHADPYSKRKKKSRKFDIFASSCFQKRKSLKITYFSPILPTKMTTFYLNPYDQALNLTQKEHLKLYTDNCALESLTKKCFLMEHKRNNTISQNLSEKR